MTNQWQAFINETFNDPAVVKHAKSILHINDLQSELNAAATGDILVDLSYRGQIMLSGDDATNFLQGQVTNDVKLLDDHQSQYAGYCNPKGRLLALFLAVKHQDRIHLAFDHGLLEGILKRLGMYVLRAKVSLEDVSNSVVRLGLAGPASANHLKAYFHHIPQNRHESVTVGETTIIRLPFINPAFEILTNEDEAIRIWQTFAKQQKPVGKLAWDWLETHSGIPEITLETKEAFVPQMVNLDALQGINYKKGCYTGQEIVARTHYLGKVKRRTQLGHIDTTVSPKPGDEIKDANQQVIGLVVRATPALESGFDLLFECRLESIETGIVFWQQQTIQLLPMPYEVVKE
jgi:folate-binding protein YgfZ